MDLYFNEKCLECCIDIDTATSFLFKSLSVLSNAKIKIFTSTEGLKKWKKTLEGEFDFTARRYFYTIVKLFEECETTSPQYYYYYIPHQDQELKMSDNLGYSSIIFATDKFLSNQNVALLNLPESIYSYRPHLSILKSSFDAKIKDELANINCFDSAIKLKQFVLLHKKIKVKVSQEKFKEFSTEYFNFFECFDFDNWQPKKIGSDGNLIPENSFPASNNKVVAEEISTWYRNKGSTEDKIAYFKEIGGLILEIHGYTKNILLSNYYEYDIYEAGYRNKKLLISLDVENGLFEVIDFHGIHIGVYDYLGECKKHYTDKKDIEEHSLKNLKDHMFIFK